MHEWKKRKHAARMENAGVGYVLIPISHVLTLLAYLLTYLTPHPYLLIT